MSTRRTCLDCRAPITRKHARYCDACRWRHRGKPAVWVWTPERDARLRAAYVAGGAGYTKRIADELGFPRHIVTRRAALLGLTAKQDRRDWTAAEETFLAEHAGSRHVHWMAKRLGRTVTSVVVKLKRLEISRRWREGYTLRELELCFGVDHRAIERWARDGKLATRRRGTAAAHDAWYVTDEDVLRFIVAHPLAFELRRVDQTWFMDLMLAGGLIRKAMEAAREDALEVDEELVAAGGER